MPSQPDTVGDRCNLSENVIRESNTISMISQAPSVSTTYRNFGRFIFVERSGFFMILITICSALPPRAVGQVIVFLQAAESRPRISLAQDTVVIGVEIQLTSIDNQSRHDSLLCPTACTPTNVKTEFPTQLPPKPKRRSKVHLISFPTLKRIRRLLASSGDQPLLTQKAVWIAPAQCAETVVVASTGHQNRPTNHSSSRREDMIIASEDGARGCCSFFG
ncbi:hypothetical protein F5141DRAFT_6372 [Pisolithus sp. B1]|nr:hypothetical protein F5141DRAFT_6372 [Pisolithus sp. B1]